MTAPASRGYGRFVAPATAGLLIAVMLAAAWMASDAGGEAGAEHWIRNLLPDVFFRVGPRGLKWWQWLAFPVLTVLAWVIGRPLGAITRRLLQLASRRTVTAWDDRLLVAVGPALTMLWTIGVFRMLLPWLALPAGPGGAQPFLHGLLAAIVGITVFSAIWRSVAVVTGLMVEQPWVVDNPSARSLVIVAGNLAKAAILIGGLVTTIAAFGYPVSTVVAGLGIGGVALAFGAQKTVENLFGSVSIAADQPCRVGDYVKVEDVSGTVERIGMRSTQIRTLDRTLVTIPNGRLSELRIETFAMRDRIRFASVLTLSYDTTEAQMRVVLAGVERVLRQHPKIWHDTVAVRFAAFGDSSLNVEVQCWFETADFEEFRVFRQEVLFGIMRVVTDAGTTFAYPTRTVRIVSETPAQPAPADRP
jgi:MscS family membrane protein